MITGCLRVSKESIFTGLNNLEIISILNENYARYFGFTQPEVEEMLYYYGISEKKEELKRWYDGYLFGNTEVYNPWSVVNYIKTAITNQIDEKGYADGLTNEGYEKILKYGICFCQKSCRVFI